MHNHAVVSQGEWLTAHKALLLREMEATHLRDKINAGRLVLPWVKVEKEYIFDTPKGEENLPEWAAGCPGCSFLSDHIDGALPHLEHHDVTMTAVSRAPLAKIEAYKKRMGWRFPWVSAFNSDFNYGYHVSFKKYDAANGRVLYNVTETPAPGDGEAPGLSSFYKDESGGVFHTYSSYARGPEELIGALMILDRAPKGRNESRTTDFVRRHDEYGK